MQPSPERNESRLPLFSAAAGHAQTTAQSIRPIHPLQDMQAQPAQPIAGFYLHIPFCFHKCHYCDFYSLVQSPHGPDRQEAFLTRLQQEIHLLSHTLRQRARPRTIFVGGGTPTLLPPELWRRLLTTLHAALDLDALVEFTVEANPETLTAELLDTLRAGGVNRLSLGAQSFDPALLKTLERWHEPARVAQAVALARQAGFDNFNLDLIFAIPDQTLELLDRDLEAALALAPTHVSCYGLTYEPNTAMTQRLKLGQFMPIDEEVERAMYARVMERLAAAGFEHYEVSNWARPGRACQHNLLYWRNENWLGAGPSAASHVAGWRWKNVPHLGQYLDNAGWPPVQDVEHLDAPARAGEALMLALRLRQGAPRAWLRELLPPTDARWGEIELLVAQNLLLWADDHLRLTEQGLFVADGVIGRLLA